LSYDLTTTPFRWNHESVEAYDIYDAGSLTQSKASDFSSRFGPLNGNYKRVLDFGGKMESDVVPLT
jgi:hypothetical protein